MPSWCHKAWSDTDQQQGIIPDKIAIYTAGSLTIKKGSLYKFMGQWVAVGAGPASSINTCMCAHLLLTTVGYMHWW